MNMTTPTLSDLLVMYLAELDSIGYHVHDRMVTPGLTDAEIDDLVAPTGLVLPDDVREWWHFQNGLIDTGPFSRGPLFKYFEPTSLDHAVSHWAANARPQEWDQWRPSCFPVLCESPYFIVVECGPDDYGSVWLYAPKDGHFARGKDSFTEVVAEWLAIARAGGIDEVDEGCVWIAPEHHPNWYNAGM
jgi:hypothetical protein